MPSQGRIGPCKVAMQKDKVAFVGFPEDICRTTLLPQDVGGRSMPRMRASKQKRLKETVPVVGAVGVSLTLAGGASAAGTTGLPADIPFRATAPGPTITLTEEEISDVSLATFYVFDKEVPRLGELGEQYAQRRGGCRAGGGCRGGYRGGCRGCRGCRGCGGRGCRGCGIGCIGGCGGCSCSCCIEWGACRYVCTL
jgi:hypothetical protein